MHNIRRRSLFISLVTAVCVMAQTGSDRYPVVRDGKVGFIDSAGNEVIAPRFFAVADMAHFNDGLAPVAGPEGAGYIDPSGRFVIGPNQEWGQPRSFHDGIAVVLIWGRDGALNTPAFINRTGHVVFSSRGADEQAYFSEGLMPLRDSLGWGFVDKNFRWVIPPRYDRAEQFSDGLAPVQMAGKWGYIDKTGNQIVPPRYDLAWQFSDGLGRIRIDHPTGEKAMTMEGPRPVYRRQFGFVDTGGKEVIPPQFESATDFQQGRAFAMPPGSKRLAIIDRRGNILHPPEYEQTREFHEGLAAACVGGRWGYVDLAGSWAIAPRFNGADDFWHGLARVAREDGYGYVDRTGRAVWNFAK
jgi:hypothetical protein